MWWSSELPPLASQADMHQKPELKVSNLLQWTNSAVSYFKEHLISLTQLDKQGNQAPITLESV